MNERGGRDRDREGRRRERCTHREMEKEKGMEREGENDSLPDSRKGHLRPKQTPSTKSCEIVGTPLYVLRD